jgi:hypothetical protein
MQRGPAKSVYGYVESTRAAREEPPMSMLEAAIFFGVLSLILDGIGAVVARVTGIPSLFAMCLSFFVTMFLITVTGFVAARYTAVVNGVWAGIMVAAINSVFSQLIYYAALPEFREVGYGSSQSTGVISTGSAIGMVLGLLIAAIGTIIGGAFFGFIGAAISQLGIFRPQDGSADEY